MNLLDLSSANRETHALISTGGWVGTLPDGYTATVDGKKFTVRTYSSGRQVLVHKLPDGGEIHHRREGGKSWVNNYGKLHREDGPARIHPSGTEMWYRNHKLHREDGPAVVKADGTEMWYRDDEIHREDGPAIISADGFESWYRRGKLHREDGPAIISADGTVEYWINGKQVNKEDLL